MDGTKIEIVGSGAVPDRWRVILDSPALPEYLPFRRVLGQSAAVDLGDIYAGLGYDKEKLAKIYQGTPYPFDINPLSIQAADVTRWLDDQLLNAGRGVQEIQEA